MTDLQLGEWVNIIGYVHTQPKSLRMDKISVTEQNTREVQVQAVMVWSAGSLKIDVYEEAAVTKIEQDRKTYDQSGSH